jgi:hypothetical protein
MGRYDEAEPLYWRAMGIVQKTVGQNHPHFKMVMENLTRLYMKTGKEGEADKLKDQVSHN